MRIAILLMILSITSCSAKLEVVHKPLDYQELCEYRLTEEQKTYLKSMQLEDKRFAVGMAQGYLARIKLLCELAEAHNQAHERVND